MLTFDQNLLFRLLIRLQLLLGLVVWVILSVPIDELLLNPYVPHMEGNVLLSAPFKKLFGREWELKFKVEFFVAHFDGQQGQFEVFLFWCGGRVDTILNRQLFGLTLVVFSVFFLIIHELGVNPKVFG